MLESNLFLNVSMPWSSLSIAHGMHRHLSNDGPILWTRPGEQVVPTADLPKSPFKRPKRLVGTFYVWAVNSASIVNLLE